MFTVDGFYRRGQTVLLKPIADEAVSSLDTKRIEARRDRVTAQRHLSEAQSRQRAAVNALAEARRWLDAAREMAGKDE